MEIINTIDKFFEYWLDVSPIKNPCDFFNYYETHGDEIFLETKQMLNPNVIITKENSYVFVTFFKKSDDFNDVILEIKQNPYEYYSRYYLDLLLRSGYHNKMSNIYHNINLLFNYRLDFEKFNLIWVTFLLKDMITFNRFKDCKIDYMKIYNNLVNQIKKYSIKPRHLKTKKNVQMMRYYYDKVFQFDNICELLKPLTKITNELFDNHTKTGIIKFDNEDKIAEIHYNANIAKSALFG